MSKLHELARIALTKGTPLQLVAMGQIRGQNATYRNQLGSLRSENMSLQRKASDLARQLSDSQTTLVRSILDTYLFPP